MCYFSKQALVLVGTFIKLPKTYYPLSYFLLCIQITKDILPFELLLLCICYFFKSWKRAWSMLQMVLNIKMYSSGSTRESWILRNMLELESDDIYIIYDIYILLRLFKIIQNLFIIDKRDIKIQSAEILSNNVFLKCR